MCAHRLWDDPAGLRCNLDDGHDCGHVYTGTWAPDAHDKSEAVQG